MRIDDIKVGEHYLWYASSEIVVLRIDIIPERQYGGRTRNMRKPFVRFEKDGREQHVQPRDIRGPWADYKAMRDAKELRERNVNGAIEVLSGALGQENFERMSDGFQGTYIHVMFTLDQARALALRLAGRDC